MLKRNASSSMPVVGSDKEQPRAVKRVFHVVKIRDCPGTGVCTITGTTDCCKLSQSTVYRLHSDLVKELRASPNSVKPKRYPGFLITRLPTIFYVTHLSLIICAVEKIKCLSSICMTLFTVGILFGVIQTKEVDAYA